MEEGNQDCPLCAAQRNTRPTWLSMDLDILTLLSKQANPQRKVWPVGSAGVEHRDWERQEVRKISFPSKDSQASVNILLPPPPPSCYPASGCPSRGDPEAFRGFIVLEAFFSS